jgi:hypothetical protein
VQHELLLIHVLGEVLIYDKAGGIMLGETSESGRLRWAHIHRILLASIRALNPSCGDGFAALADADPNSSGNLEFLSSKDTKNTAKSPSDPTKRLADLIASPACRNAAALGVYTGWWPGKAPYDELLHTAVQQLAEISEISPANTQQPLSSLIQSESSGVNKKAIDLDQLSEEQIRSASEVVASLVVSDQQKRAVAEQHGKPLDLPHVFIHYDNNVHLGQIQNLAKQLSEHQYFVDRTLRYVSPTAKSCASRSQVKLFHKGDLDIGSALEQDARIALFQSYQSFLQSVRGIDRKYSKNSPLKVTGLSALKITDLSAWSLASKVPRGQLELWVISKEGCTNAS